MQNVRFLTITFKKKKKLKIFFNICIDFLLYAHLCMNVYIISDCHLELL